MRCVGRTSLKNRCKNPTKFLACKTHRSKVFGFLAITIPASLASYIAIYSFISNDTKPGNGEDLPKPVTVEPFPEDDDSFKILILPFDPLEHCESQDSDMGKTIYKRLVELKEQDSLNISVRYDTNQFCPSGFEQGKSIGSEFNADLVLWGETYERCEIDNLKACLKYVLLKGEDIPIKRQASTGIESVSSMTDISQGYLQKDIDYVVFWTLGSEAYAQGRYRTAVERFAKVLRLRPEDSYILNGSGASV